jgi:hypothetical protein
MESTLDGTYPFGGTYCSPPVKIEPPSLTATLNFRGALNGGGATVQHKLWTGSAWSAWSNASSDTAINVVSSTPFSWLTYAVNLTGNGAATPVMDAVEIILPPVSTEQTAAAGSNRFALWPSPAPRNAKLESTAGVERVEVFNVAGKRVRVFHAATFRNDLPPGIYTAALFGKAGVPVLRKLVVF